MRMRSRRRRARDGQRDVFLVGIKSALPTSREALDRIITDRLDTEALAELRVAGIDGAAALSAMEIAGPDALARYAAGAAGEHRR